MALFGKKDKDSEEEKETLEIKEAAGMKKDMSTPLPLQEQEEVFVNPFKEETQMSQKPIEKEDLFKGLGENQNSSSMNQPFQNPSFSHSSMQMPQMKMTTSSPEEIKELIDETVEKIIEEKWDKVTNDVEKVLKWKANVENEIHTLGEGVIEIKENFERLEKKIMTKINDYDKDILDIGSEIKALEKVFQKITPTLVNNVNELSKIARTFKENPNYSESLENDENSFTQKGEKTIL